MEQKEDQIFFVSVKEPSEVKRNLLESLKDIVESLQRFEKFKAIREEKLENISKLREDIKELIKLNSGLKAALPETKLRIAIEKAVKKKRHKAKKKTVKKTPRVEVKEAEKPKPMTELEKLESELGAIESRLTGLK